MGGVCCQNQQGVQVRFQNVTYYIKHQPNATIKELKANIEKENNVSVRDIVLSYKGNRIHDLDTLESLGFLINSDTLVMEKVVLDGPEISITVRSINFTEEIKINPNLAVDDLKRKIEQKRNIPVSKQRLIFSGKILIDNQTICSQGINNRSTVHCTTPLVA